MKTTDIAYNKGVDAWYRNPREINPYPKKSLEREFWFEGQRDAKFDNDLFESGSGHYAKDSKL